MMGDNTRGSADGRDWTRDQDRATRRQGLVVDPRTNTSRARKVLWGNKRPNGRSRQKPSRTPTTTTTRCRSCSRGSPWSCSSTRWARSTPLTARCRQGTTADGQSVRIVLRGFTGPQPGEKDWDRRSQDPGQLRPARAHPRVAADRASPAGRSGPFRIGFIRSRVRIRSGAAWTELLRTDNLTKSYRKRRKVVDGVKHHRQEGRDRRAPRCRTAPARRRRSAWSSG